MKTVNDLINELQALKPSIREKPVVVVAPNGMEFEAQVKIRLERPLPGTVWPNDVNTVTNVVINYE